MSLYRNILFVLALLMLSAWLFPLYAEEESPGIVVWELQANKGVDETDVQLISSFVANQVAKYSGNNVISESDILTILKGEETRQRCGAENTSCVAEVGAALGVTEAINGDMGKIGDYWMLNLRRINVRTAAVVGRSSRNIKGDINTLIESLPEAVAELFGSKSEEIPEIQELPTEGNLFVDSEPERAKVWINGREVGETPLETALEVNSYRVSVGLWRYESQERSVDITPGETTELFFKLERFPLGRLSVKSDPSGARLFLDGDEIGRTPYEEKLDSGSYKLELKLEGFKTLKETFTVKKNEATELNLILKQDFPMNPYTKYGYVTFFSGVGLATFGSVAIAIAHQKAEEYQDATTINAAKDARNANRAWSGATVASYTIGGALMATGIVLWILSPEDSDWAKKHPAWAGLTANVSGRAVSFEGRW